jgi:hypothetical protein
MLSAQPFVTLADIDAPNHSRIREDLLSATHSGRRRSADEDGRDAPMSSASSLSRVVEQQERATWSGMRPLKGRCHRLVRTNEALRSSSSLWTGLLGLLARPRTPQRFKRECEKAFMQSI